MTNLIKLTQSELDARVFTLETCEILNDDCGDFEKIISGN
jgi:hypothetical protein